MTGNSRYLRHEALLWWALAVVMMAAYAWPLTTFFGPDEGSHFFVVQVYKITRSWPSAALDPSLLRGEIHQPPLYYAISAVAVRVFEVVTPYVEELCQRFRKHSEVKIQALLQRPTDDSAQQYEINRVKQLRFLRFLWIPLLASTVAITFRMGRMMFPEAPWIARSAALSHAMLPQFAFANAVVDNDGLSFVLAALLLFEICRLMVEPGSWRRRAVRIGLWSGLSALTKLTVLMVSPIAFAALILRAEHARCRAVLMAGVVFLGCAVPLWLHNYQQWGDPFAKPLVDRNYRSLYHPIVFSEIEWSNTVKTFCGKFSNGDFELPDWQYAWYVAAMILGVVGLAFPRLTPAAGSLSSQRWLKFLLAAFFLLNVSSMITFLQMDWLGGGQGRYYFPSLPALALLWSEGWQRLGGKRFGSLATVLVSLSWLALGIYTYCGIYLPHFR